MDEYDRWNDDANETADSLWESAISANRLRKRKLTESIRNRDGRQTQQPIMYGNESPGYGEDVIAAPPEAPNILKSLRPWNVVEAERDAYPGAIKRYKSNYAEYGKTTALPPTFPGQQLTPRQGLQMEQEWRALGMRGHQARFGATRPGGMFKMRNEAWADDVDVRRPSRNDELGPDPFF